MGLVSLGCGGAILPTRARESDISDLRAIYSTALLPPAALVSLPSPPSAYRVSPRCLS